MKPEIKIHYSQISNNHNTTDFSIGKQKQSNLNDNGYIYVSNTERK